MNIKSLIISLGETILKIIILAIAIMFIFKGVTKAYEFGYKVFADEPMSLTNPKTITVGVAEDAKTKDVANMLEEKGLINDADLFVVQEFLSAYHDKIKPGIYDLSTGMTAHEMLRVMSLAEEEQSDEEMPSPSSVEDISEETPEDEPVMYDEGIIDEGMTEDMTEDMTDEGVQE